ncbi:ATP-grasp domain-containing protein [Ideonella sp. 4Y11]|uniref:ATP-grasp domain-containing protein n=1 Tax=Ideonella aquatica TaxID=2824119 RepID=A0A940YMK6_9BURK|nr:ATP-grasp domain-containing protein [Ideonella aquatica]MBQ0960696.1 ATP-grasp domain-containing protein [Ideonella aquatica]
MTVRGPLALAGLSVRAAAQAARRDGLRVLALDLFGDADTCEAAEAWRPLGDPARPQIDGERLLGLLARRRDELAGWWPGSGFEDRADLLEAGSALCPLLGTPAEGWRRLADPRTFFERLDAWGIAHPAVAFERPDTALGWLRKRGGSRGGEHVQPAESAAADEAPAPWYWQRWQDGAPMSMTLLCAAPGRACVLGLNRQWHQPQAGQPFAYGGVLGPVGLPGRAGSLLQGVAERLAAAFDLRGVVGVDFIWDEENAWILEVNPRWPASAGLYAAQGGLVRAHLQACLHGRLPEPAQVAAWRPPRLRGLQLLRRPHAVQLDLATVALWARQSDVHDRPSAAMRLPAGAPLCTVSAEADDETALRRRLDARCAALASTLEIPA